MAAIELRDLPRSDCRVDPVHGVESARIELIEGPAPVEDSSIPPMSQAIESRQPSLLRNHLRPRRHRSRGRISSATNIGALNESDQR